MRRLTCTEGNANKFWEAGASGRTLTVSWGKIGTAGQTKTKSFKDAASAQKELEKLVREKLGKGYRQARAAESGAKVSAPVKAGKASSARISGPVGQRWRDIEVWLGKHAPHALQHFRPGAAQAAIAKAEKKLGRSLPADYKAFLTLHNGQVVDAPMVEWGSLLPVEELPAMYLELGNVFDEDDEHENGEIDRDDVSPQVKRVAYSRGWVPIGKSPTGREFLCIDYTPSKRGVAGQIILVVIDGDERTRVAKTFADLLALYFKQAKSGELALDT
jgi:cell wall assembly regulator SMI1/predicted DNA-binding WGR domain protein